MSDVVIRSVKESDIDFVYGLCKSEDWGYSRGSIERIVSYEPNGFLVAEVDGKRVGHVFSISSGKIGWIGLLIVEKEQRRRGIGTLLMKQAMNYLLESGVQVMKLEAVPKIANLYRRLGFVDEFDSLRFMRINKKRYQLTSSNIEPLRKNEIIEIAAFDSKYFGADRAMVLRRLYEDNPELCFAARRNFQTMGYIMSQEAETGYRIGPWVCSPHHPMIAKELILECMRTIKASSKLFIGVPAVNNTAVRLLHELDFTLYSKSIRMRFGKKLENERVEGIFSIAGPEKG